MPTLVSSTITFLSMLLACWWLGSIVVRLLPEEIPAPRLFLALPLGIITFLVSFSVVAHLVPTYWISLPCSFVFPACALRFLRKEPVDPLRAQSYWCLGLFILIFALTLLMHSHWPSLHWENSGDKVGVEKLFNLSLQQSFLHGSTYPPEWIWLSGEPSFYYLLPKVFPGIASWLTRVLFLDPLSGGYHFLYSEALMNALAASCCAGWCITLVGFVVPRSSISTRTLIGMTLGSLSIVSTHFFALKLGLARFISGEALNWWELQEQVVHYTQNQYPAFLVMLGDNHAYSQVMPLQLTLWSLCAIVFTYNRIHFCLVLVTAIGFAGVFLSHAPSVLLNVVSLAPGIILAVVIETVRGNFKWVKSVCGHILLVGICSALLVFINSTVTGDTKWVVPGADISSPLDGFLSVQFWPLLWCAILAGLCILQRTVSTKGVFTVWEIAERTRSREVFEWCIAPVLLSCVVGYYTGRPALFVTGLCASAVLLLTTAVHSTESPLRQRIVACIAVGAFGIWVLPELLSIDNRADNRTLWIRFNIVLRFWPEGYYLIPFMVTAAFAAPLSDALGSRWWMKRGGVIFFSIGILLTLLFSLSHLPGSKNRAARIGVAPSLNGYDFLSLEAPHDWEIIQFLAQLPDTPKVVLGEACGTWRYQGVPVNYAWPGRISAFSGRHSVCGWTRHAELHQPALTHPWRESFVTRDRFIAYENALLALLNESGAALPSWNQQTKSEVFNNLARSDNPRVTMRELGVTHLVFGEREQQYYGSVTLQRLAEVVGGTVVFRASATQLGVIKMEALAGESHGR